MRAGLMGHHSRRGIKSAGQQLECPVRDRLTVQLIYINTEYSFRDNAGECRAKGRTSESLGLLA